MNRFEAEAHSVLRPYIHSYWGGARDLSSTGRFTVTPDCFLELIFFVDPPSVEDAGGRCRQLSVCTLIPLLSEPIHLLANGVVRCASVRWHAWAAGILFPQADASSRAWHDVSAAFCDLLPLITAALRREAWAEIAAAFDRTLPRALADARPAAPGLAAARAFVSSPDGTVAEQTDKVAARQGRSRRQIERQVRSLTHRSPKQLVCLRRFQFARDSLWARPDTDLASLAFEAGYADQAHLTRHFRRYAGQSPGEFKRDCARLKAFPRPGDVAFVQDGLPTCD